MAAAVAGLIKLATLTDIGVLALFALLVPLPSVGLFCYVALKVIEPRWLAESYSTCDACGYTLEGLTNRVCPECGCRPTSASAP